MVAFHFPPLAGSSGIQRTLRFVQHLPVEGWQPLVLSAHPRAYEAVSADLLSEVPPDTVVERPFALDAARHLAIAGRYPGFLALPDRWRSWAWGAVSAGMRMIRKYRPDVIWSTYPIATAHHIALQLHRLSGIPWVADFRDPMAQEGYPEDPRVWKSFERIEQSVVRHASRMVFVTPSALAHYRERYASVSRDRFAMIENGYDEESFAAAERDLVRAPLSEGRFTLLHSGIVYPSDRDPSAFFDALERMHHAGRINANTVRIRFRAPVHTELLSQLAAKSGTSELIEILPPIPYREALAEMMRADGLLIMQGANCNQQVPAKLYEYFRARRPILGLADPAGDTAAVMRDAGVDHVGLLEDSQQVELVLGGFLSQVPAGSEPPPMVSQLTNMSRRARARALAALLDDARHPGR